MSEIVYSPGSWRAVVAPRGIAVLPPSVDAAVLGRVWTALDSGDGLGAVLSVLAEAFGGGFSALPPFAVATFDAFGAGSGAAGSAAAGVVRVAVRGDVSVSIDEDSSAAVVVSGADVSTWSERVAPAATALVIRTPDSAPDAERFVIASGVVLAGEVAITIGAPAPISASRPPEAPAAGAAAPVSAPLTPAASAPAPAPAPELTPEAEPAPAAALTPAPAPAVELTQVVADPSEMTQVAASEGELPQVVSPGEAEAAPESSTEPEGEVQGLASTEVEELESTQAELPDDAYDHLWGATVVKSVEDAAVRELDDDEEAEPVAAGASAAAVAPSVAAPPPATTAPPAQPATAPQAPRAAAVAPAVPSTGLIDSVPGFGSVGAASGSPALLGTTVPPQNAAPATAPTSSPATAPAGGDDDHDGLTVTVSELEAMRRLAGAGAEAAAAPGLPSSALGRIVLSTGESYDLDRPVIIGRRPRANRVQADAVPVLVTVASPEQDISRNHLEIRLEGRHVLAVDLATTNGSVLHREGTPPKRLGPNEPELVLSGDIVDLGDGVTVAFEEIP